MKAFISAAKLVTVGLAAAVAWQVFLDPIFFPIFHDTSNITAQAFVHMIHENFSWIPEIIGLTGDGGFLNTEFMKSTLAPHIAAVSPAAAMPEVTNAAQNLDVYSVLQLGGS